MTMAVEEGGGEADDDGRGEEGAAAAGVQEGHRQNCPNSQIHNSLFHSQFKIIFHIIKGLLKFVSIPKYTILCFTHSPGTLSSKASSKLPHSLDPQSLVSLTSHRRGRLQSMPCSKRFLK